MARVKGAMMTLKKKVLKLAKKGYWGSKSDISKWLNRPDMKSTTTNCIYRP